MNNEFNSIINEQTNFKNNILHQNLLDDIFLAISHNQGTLNLNFNLWLFISFLKNLSYNNNNLSLCKTKIIYLCIYLFIFFFVFDFSNIWRWIFVSKYVVLNTNPIWVNNTPCYVYFYTSICILKILILRDYVIILTYHFKRLIVQYSFFMYYIFVFIDSTHLSKGQWG